LLLTFFVFALVLMVRAEILDVSLPTLEAANPAGRGSAVVVSLDREGRLFVDGEPIERGELAAHVAGLLAARPDSRLLLAADEGGQTGHLLGLVDELHRAGLAEFSIVGRTERTPGEK